MTRAGSGITSSGGLPDVVLFDLDGTLVDSREGITAAVRHALGALGLSPPAEEELNGYLGPPLLDSFQRLAGLDAARAETAVAAYREHYTAFGIAATTTYPGIAPLLGAIRDDGVHLGVATSKPTVYAAQILAQCEIAHLFEVVQGASLDHVLRHKPEVIARCLELGAWVGAGAVMVGDRAEDMVGARRNGLAGVGALWGYGDAAELTAAGALRLSASAPELLGSLRELGRPGAESANAPR